MGCTDPLAMNFDPIAQSNDGSCVYSNTTIPAMILTDPMPIELQEQSGMIKFNDRLWIHLDGGNSEDLFTWNYNANEIENHFVLQNVVNTDWEDIAQDETHIYLGDFGNNVGNRTDLKIYKIAKSDLLDSDPEDVIPEIIEFSYPEQTDFSNQIFGHNFDCESMVVRNNMIFIFTKEWVSNKSTIYRVPNIAGPHDAELMGVLDVNGLVAGADFDPVHNIIVLCGYQLSTNLEPFVYLLWDFQVDDLTSGNKRRSVIEWMDYCQMESIAYNELGKWYVGNEYFETGPLAVYNQLRQIDISEFLTGIIGLEELNKNNSLIYPNPSFGNISLDREYDIIEVYSIEGNLIDKFYDQQTIEIKLVEGIYVLKMRIGSASRTQKVLIKKSL